MGAMLGNTYPDEVCSAARALELIGERWSLLIVRNALFAGSTRFSDFQRRLGIAPNILTTRLNTFVTAGIFRVSGTSRADREYHLTAKGRDLVPTIIALTEWGDRWARAEQGPPVTYRHRNCAAPVEGSLQCTGCGDVPEMDEVVADVASWARAARADR